VEVRRVLVAVGEPFRLDLTVCVLQRLASNPVEVWVPGTANPTLSGRYLRAFDTPRGLVAWIVTENPSGSGVALELRGPAGDPAPWIARVRRALGADVDLAPFYGRARHFPPLVRLVRAMRGVRPPRFASLHESVASVLLFQQVSLASAMATLRRLVVTLSSPVEVDGATLHPFPAAAAIAVLSEGELRAFGMSAVKARALHAACASIASGELCEESLAALPSPELHARLLALHGVGPWTAALLMLRGFGRLDQFPPGDVAAERLLREFGAPVAATLSPALPLRGRENNVRSRALPLSEREVNGRELLDALGPTRGMLYYHLFLHRMATARRGPFAPGVTAASRAPPPAPPRRTRRAQAGTRGGRAT
jgi:DNA-3-methyladenine glycosylase II